jgi:hypothetical protein
LLGKFGSRLAFNRIGAGSHPARHFAFVRLLTRLEFLRFRPLEALCPVLSHEGLRHASIDEFQYRMCSLVMAVDRKAEADAFSCYPCRKQAYATGGLCFKKSALVTENLNGSASFVIFLFAVIQISVCLSAVIFQKEFITASHLTRRRPAVLGACHSRLGSKFGIL